MRFHTVAELLEQISRFHLQASIYCQQLAKGVERKRVKMMLDYLARHEQELAAAMTRYQDDIQTSLAHTWFDESPDFSFPDALRRYTELQANGSNSLALMEVDDVLRLGLHLDDYLIWCFENLAAQADTDTAREVFSNLQAMAQNDKRKLVRDTLGLEGI